MLDGRQGRRPHRRRPRPGQDRVRLTIQNTRPSGSNVVLPPGLVAASAAGQRAAAAAASRAWASGSSTNRPGGFGEFRGTRRASGFRSVPVDRRRAAAGRRGPRRPDGRAGGPRGLPELRPADPDPPRQVRADGRGRLQPPTPASARPCGAWRPWGPATASPRR